jgi:molecular chaperone GrpE
MTSEKDNTNDDLKEQVEEILKEAQDQADAEKAAEDAKPECGHDPDTLEALARERADFLNFKTRATKDQERARWFGKRDAVLALMPVLDEIGRAKGHENIDPETPFGKIVSKLDEAITGLGVVSYGSRGDVFDPNLHEALMNKDAADVTDMEVKEGEVLVYEVVEAGYKLGDEIIKTAKVLTVS